MIFRLILSNMYFRKLVGKSLSCTNSYENSSPTICVRFSAICSILSTLSRNTHSFLVKRLKAHRRSTFLKINFSNPKTVLICLLT